MRIETCLNKRNAAVSNMRELYSSARYCGMPHREILARKRKIVDNLAKCPNWVLSYVQGYESSLYDIQERELVFGGFIGERFYSVHSNRADYYGKHGFSAREYSEPGLVSRQGHYWADFNPPRPFSVKANP